jgi:hypothetical protein
MMKLLRFQAKMRLIKEEKRQNLKDCLLEFPQAQLFPQLQKLQRGLKILEKNSCNFA